MSYLAHIAYENDDGTYDLYKSHNGGEDFYLTPYLRQVTSGDADRDLKQVDPKKPWDEMGGSLPDEVDTVDSLDQAINSSPVATRISRDQIAGEIDFVHSEALYIVEDDVKLFLPVWTYSRVLDALREFYELTVYNIDDISFLRAQAGGSLLDDDAEPVRELSDADFDPGAITEPALRKYVETIHLSLFQTGCETAADGTRSPLLGGVLFNHFTDMAPRETSFTIPKAEGRGVFIRLDWSDDLGRPINQEPIRDYIESARVDASMDVSKRRRAGEEVTEICEESKLIGRLIKRFGSRVAPIAIPPYDQYLENFRETYGATARSDGDLYRVVTVNDAGTVTMRAKDQLVYPEKDLGRTTNNLEADLYTVSPDGSEAVTAQFDQFRPGDIVRAEVTAGGDSNDVRSAETVELVSRLDLEFVTADYVPQSVHEMFDKKIGSQNSMETDEGAVSARGPLRSYVDDIDGSRLELGEQVVMTGADSDGLWTRTKTGKFGEEMYGGFRSQPGVLPSEAIFVNPPSEPFWYGLVFEHPRSGLAREIREELDIPFPD